MSSLTIGQYLRLLRIQRGWSQSDVAKRLGSDRSRYSHWECGGSLPRPLALQRLASIFEVPIADLIALVPQRKRGSRSWHSHHDPTHIRCRRCTICLEPGDDFEGEMCAECISEIARYQPDAAR